MNRDQAADLDRLSSVAQIADCLSLYCHAFDRRRWSLFDQIFHADGLCETPAFSGAWRDWLDQARAAAEATISVSHHQLGNMMTDISGDGATVEAYVTAHFRMKSNPSSSDPVARQDHAMVIGSRYAYRFERRDGQWRIAAHRAFRDWSRIEPLNEGGFADVPLSRRGGFGEADDATLALVARWGGDGR